MPYAEMQEQTIALLEETENLEETNKKLVKAAQHSLLWPIVQYMPLAFEGRLNIRRGAPLNLETNVIDNLRHSFIPVPRHTASDSVLVLKAEG